jgi:hypothetical protein
MLSHRHVALALTLMLATAAGCEDDSGSPVVDDGGVDQGPLGPLDHDPIDPNAKPQRSATVQRLSVQQLRRSLPVALGQDQNGRDVEWRLRNLPGLDVMAGSLGEPDYIDSTEEVLEASPLYMKFMDDAARATCDQTHQSDFQKVNSGDRVVLRFAEPADTVASQPQAIDNNLRYLKLRFHAIRLDADDSDSIASLRTLFTTGVDISADGNPVDEDDVRAGWRLVCVAMLTAPEFHLY